MMVDEFYFHRERDLPRWERIGHPLDTLTVLSCYGFVLAVTASRAALLVFAGLAVFSLIFSAKDEPVHRRVCGRGEHRVHYLLFGLHPLVLGAMAMMWWLHTPFFVVVLWAQFLLTAVFMLYQITYWNVWKQATLPAVQNPQVQINNAVYDTLGDDWYEARGDPIALLRAETRLRNPWLRDILQSRLKGSPAGAKVLDMGCGGGFLANYLAEHGYAVYAVDLSAPSLGIARKYDRSGAVHYQRADAYRLPYADASFHAVCGMDVLEHVEDPQGFIEEASRVLKPDGLFFFYTHNRNWLARLLVIKGVSWFVRNVPKNLHLYRLFIKPRELAQWCRRAGLRLEELRGVRPRVLSRAFLQMILAGTVSDRFRFVFTRSLKVSYVGYALKREEPV